MNTIFIMIGSKNKKNSLNSKEKINKNKKKAKLVKV